ncbi:uncharacterized protein [Amphiura filiformis]|uniref:uncharacterized protein n=1 Tax=Amphiura filiformis TaxID=82378 RepID=UPI003B21CDB2
MARVRNVVLLFATLCCYASISSGDVSGDEIQDNNQEQLEELAYKIAEILKSNYENDEDLVKSLSKRQANNRPGSGLPMNVPVKMSGFAFGKRDGQLVRRSAGAQAKPVKLAGFAFGKRGQLVKRSSDDKLMEDEEAEKRAALDAFTYGKRRDPSGLSAFSFGKRRDPSALSALTFGKRGTNPSGYSAFTFGKRGQMDNLHAFSFGKRGMDPSSLGAFSFGKRGRDPSALGAFSFGKRMGMNAFTFGKREDLEEDGAFEDENDDEKRAKLSSLTSYTFGKRDTQEAAAEDNRLNQEETLRTD